MQHVADQALCASSKTSEISISQHMQVKRWGLVLVHNVLGVQELLTFTEQSDVPGALLRATGAEPGRGPQRLPPWEAWVRSQTGSGSQQ